MTKLYSAIVLLLALLLTGCPDAALQIQAQTADAVAQAANTELPVLVAQFRQDGLDALALVEKQGGTADKAREELAKVEAKWAMVWKAWATLRVAHDAWATALESGAGYAAALDGLSKAYCGLLKLWPGQVPIVPLAPVLCPQ